MSSTRCVASARPRCVRGFTQLIAMVVTITLLFSGCSESEKPSAQSYRGGTRSVPVVALPARTEQLDDTVQAVGTARALKSVSLYPETAGLVADISIAADQRVAAGDLLLQLDDRDQQLAVRLAEVQLADAQRLVKRYTTVNRSSANIAESQIDEAQAAVDSARIALEQAQVNLERRRIVAPFAGRVGITDIDVGDRIDTATQVTTLDDRSQLLVDFAVPEIYVGQIQPGTPVQVKLWNSQSGHFAGEVVAVDSRIDIASRAFTARAAIDNTSDRFRPGMAFEISVGVSRGSYLSVPDVSVQWGADGAYVWIEKDGVASRRDVRLVKRLPNRLLLEADIEPGTPVIAEGVQAVREGVALRVLDPADLDRDARSQLGAAATDGAVNNG